MAAVVAAALIVLLLTIVANPAAARGQTATPPKFRIQSLGYLPGGDDSSATAINARGEVAGFGETFRPHHPNYPHPDEAFLFTNGRLVQLGLPPGSQESFAEGVNDAGHVAVTVERADRQGHLMAYVMEPFSRGPTWTKLPEPTGRYPHGSVSAINDSGAVAGQSPAVDNTHAAVWRVRHGRYILDRSLLSLKRRALVNGIDNAGDIVGTDYGTDTAQSARPLLWSGQESGRPMNLGCTRYAGPPFHCTKGAPGEALAVARSGYSHTLIDAVGVRFKSLHSLAQVAVWWSFNSLTRSRGPAVAQATILPLLKGYKLSEADALNANGWIVGEMDTLSGGYPGRLTGSHPSAVRFKDSIASGPAVLWLNHAVYDLNHLIPRHSGWSLQQATGVNESGQIVGNGLYDGRQTGFLLTPR
jgi:uncharacterized membrane protein